MRILIVFRSATHARDAEFNVAARHIREPQIRAWWPSAGSEWLRGREFALIVIMPGVARYAAEGTEETATDWQRAVVQMRLALRIPPSALIGDVA